MSSRNQVFAAGALALVIAVASIGALAYFVPMQPTGQPSTSQQGQGFLSLLLTDPPTVPDGVTGVFVTYDGVAVHVAQAQNDSGWHDVSSTGTVDLMRIVNVSTTIAAANVSNGDYNLLRFNLTSAQVLFDGKNYTASVPSSSITVQILGGGIKVNSSSPSAAIIDMQPVVFNIGSSSNPEFVIRPSAQAYTVPKSAITPEMKSRGGTVGLSDKAWWADAQHGRSANVEITSGTLTASSLSLTLDNTGAQNVTLSVLTVSPVTASQCGAAQEHGSGHANGHETPACLMGSAIFVVDASGRLSPLSNATRSAEELGGLLGGSGYVLPPGASITLSYSGQVSFGFGMPASSSSSTVVQGDQYLVSVVGRNAQAGTTLVAS